MRRTTFSHNTSQTTKGIKDACRIDRLAFKIIKKQLSETIKNLWKFADNRHGQTVTVPRVFVQCLIALESHKKYDSSDTRRTLKTTFVQVEFFREVLHTVERLNY